MLVISLQDDFREEELTLWQEVGRNWQTVALRSIFLFCFMAFIAMIVAFCIYINCAVCCDSLTRAVCFWRPAVEYLSQCYQDPSESSYLYEKCNYFYLRMSTRPYRVCVCVCEGVGGSSVGRARDSW